MGTVLANLNLMKGDGRPGYFKSLLAKQLLTQVNQEEIDAILAPPRAVEGSVDPNPPSCMLLSRYGPTVQGDKLRKKREAGEAFKGSTERAKRRRCRVCLFAYPEKKTNFTEWFCASCGPDMPLCNSAGRTCHAWHKQYGKPVEKQRKRARGGS